MSQRIITVDGNYTITPIFSRITPPPATPAPTPAPVTPAPVTPAPVTPAPVTPAPVTPAPVTPAPVTPAPVTPAPVTPAPVEATPAPVTPAPVTPAPVTPAPVTPAPVTPAPVEVTSAPVTPAPVIAPVTPAPVTPAPVIAPVTPAPVTPAPVTPAPVTPAPTPAPIFTWRDCTDGVLKEGNIPEGYIQAAFTGAGGGICWEPSTGIGFNPSLDQALRFTWRRGLSTYPEAKSFSVVNPAYGITYLVRITTNEQIKLSVNGSNGNGIATFNLGPRATQQVVVSVTPELLDKLADGTSTLSLSVEATEI